MASVSTVVPDSIEQTWNKFAYVFSFGVALLLAECTHGCIGRAHALLREYTYFLLNTTASASLI